MDDKVGRIQDVFERGVVLSFGGARQNIDVLQEKEAAKRLIPEPGKTVEGRKRVKPREKEGTRDLTPWQRFLDL